MKRHEAASGVLAFILVSAVGAAAWELSKDPSEKVRKNAEKVEKNLQTDISSGKSVVILPGVVVAKGIKLRDVPAKIDINNSSMVDQVRSRLGNFVMYRSYVIKNDKQLENGTYSNPKYWLVGRDPDESLPNTSNALQSPTEGLVFLGINEDTLKHITYYVKSGQKRANICPDGITGAFESPVKLDASGDAYIAPDGFKKDVGLIRDMTDNQVESQVIDTLNYYPTAPCMLSDK